MNRKKFLVIGLLGLFMISMFAGLAVAAGEGEDIAEGLQEVGAEVGDFFNTILGRSLFGDTEMLSRVFFAILLGMIIYTVIGTFFDSANRWVTWGATGMITTLALLGLPPDLLLAIRTSYGAMGATILAVIPFAIIMAFTIKVKSVVVARITWIVFMFYYFGLYIAKVFENITAFGAGTSFADWNIVFASEGIPYLLAIVAGLIIFFWIGSIRDFMFREDLEKLKEASKRVTERRKLLHEMEESQATSLGSAPDAA